MGPRGGDATRGERTRVGAGLVLRWELVLDTNFRRESTLIRHNTEHIELP